MDYGPFLGAGATLAAAFVTIYLPRAIRRRNQVLYRLKDNRYFQGEINERIHREHDFGIIYVDLDNFTQLRKNSRRTSERLLARIAQTIFNVVGHRGHLFRCAGDEFGVLVHARPTDQLVEMAEQIRVAVELAGDPDDSKVTVSLGVANVPPTPGYEAYSRVYEAVYAAKLSGKNRVVACPLTE